MKTKPTAPAGHTPGPWHWLYFAGSNEPFAMTGADGKDVLCATDTAEGHLIVTFAHPGNKALIAAAPELLEALRNLAAVINEQRDELCAANIAHVPELADALAVIEKAEAPQ